jgi:BirA family biotin operon repressor/biotin-[acetyl-CoA-carboxylase] ligase
VRVTIVERIGQSPQRARMQPGSLSSVSGLTANDLEAALDAIRVSAPVRAEREIPSTNTLALELADAGTPEWTLVSAAHQTGGRGRSGRTWVDVPGGSLMVSVVLRPALPPARAGLLSLLAGAAMATAIRDETGRQVRCKWPNDLLLDAAKVGGILGEARIRDDRLVALVIGIGVNLVAPGDVAGAAGIGAEAGPRRLLLGWVSAFHRVYVAQEPELAERVRASWLPVADTIGREVEATHSSGDLVRGRAVGLDGFGGLVVSTDTGERTVSFGEVVHVNAG